MKNIKRVSTARLIRLCESNSHKRWSKADAELMRRMSMIVGGKEVPRSVFPELYAVVEGGRIDVNSTIILPESRAHANP